MVNKKVNTSTKLKKVLRCFIQQTRKEKKKSAQQELVELDDYNLS